MTIELSEEEMEEFYNEARELLDQAETHLLSLEKGGDFRNTYDAVYRVFHSVKGGAAMLGMDVLKAHVHKLETHYQECKELTKLSDENITYFLKGVDTARQIINGKTIEFDYSLFHSDTSSEPRVTPQVSGSEGITNSAPTSKDPSSYYRAEDIKVMVIDDEPLVVDALKDLLTEAGFETFSFISPKEALENLNKVRPDVVLTDYKMPEFTGFDVLKHVSQFDPNLPVIYLSGHISKDLMMESLAHGIFAAIEKPFKEDDVVTKCKNAAERYKVTQLLNNTINFIYFQYSDLDQFLLSQGAKEIRSQMHSQFRSLIEAKRKLKFLKKSPGKK